MADAAHHFPTGRESQGRTASLKRAPDPRVLFDARADWAVGGAGGPGHRLWRSSGRERGRAAGGELSLPWLRIRNPGSAGNLELRRQASAPGRISQHPRFGEMGVSFLTKRAILVRLRTNFKNLSAVWLFWWIEQGAFRARLRRGSFLSPSIRRASKEVSSKLTLEQTEL